MAALQTKNLGLVKAIFVGPSPPSNILMLWNDTTVNLPKFFDTVLGQWVLLIASDALSFTAGEAINADRALGLINGEAFHFDSSDINFYGKFIGISQTSAIIGNSVDISIEGIHVNPGWGLVQGDIYFATPIGDITNTPPTGPGLLQQVGTARDSNSILIAQNTQSIELI